MPTQPLPAELCFPAPPTTSAQPATGSANAEAMVFLQQVGAWRHAVTAWIDPTDQNEHRKQDGLTERACNALATFLKTEWSAQMKAYAAQSPYSIGAFPAQSLDPAGTTPPDAVLEILRWRAALTDYLHDVWDVLGDPFLTLEECGAMEAFLDPPGSQSRCHLCLQPFPQAQTHPDAHPCAVLGHVRAKWPAPPPAFARWAEEARSNHTPGNSMPSAPTKSAGQPKPTRPKWWQFWK